MHCASMKHSCRLERILSEILRNLDEDNRISNRPAVHVMKIVRKLSGIPTTTLRRNIAVEYSDYLKYPHILNAVWMHIIAKWEEYQNTSSPSFQTLIFAGIPNELRPRIWTLMAEPDEGVDGDYLLARYEKLINQKSDYESMIMRDLPRTFPNVAGFAQDGDCSKLGEMFNVTKAYALYDEEVGYCQGALFIVGLLLMQMTEMEAFVLLVRLMQNYRLRDLCKADMIQFGVLMYQFEIVLRENFPLLTDHFDAEQFNISVLGSYFLPLFSTALPIPLIFRIMDVLFFEGFDIVPKIGMAIIRMNHDLLLKESLEGIIQFFHESMYKKYQDDHDVLLGMARNYSFDERKMKRREQEYIRKHQYERKQLDNKMHLVDDNVTLKRSMSKLDEENKTLAGKLVKQQVLTASKDEEIDWLRKEIESLQLTIKKRDSIQSEDAADSIDSGCNFDENLDYAIAKPEDCVNHRKEDDIASRIKGIEHKLDVATLNSKITELIMIQHEKDETSKSDDPSALSNGH